MAMGTKICQGRNNWSDVCSKREIKWYINEQVTMCERPLYGRYMRTLLTPSELFSFSFY